MSYRYILQSYAWMNIKHNYVLYIFRWWLTFGQTGNVFYSINAFNTDTIIDYIYYIYNYNDLCYRL